jgi:hypothetical protein
MIDNRLVRELVDEIRQIRIILTPRLSAKLRIKGKDHMATIVVGKTAQAVWQEWSGPNGTGDKLAPAGPVSFTSSDSTIATVDATSGLITGMAIGSATISGTDSTNNLSASDTVTVVEVAQSATLTVVPNP